MRIKSSRKIRLYIKVTVNGKSYQSYIKSRIFDFVQRELTSNNQIKGSCLIVYDSQKDYWNEFKFENLSQFKKNLTTNTELPLLRYLIDK